MKKVLVAMSGGVDSTVACALLQQQGYQTAGVTLRMYSENPASVAQSIGDAQKQADKLGIPHYVLDARKAFEKKVIAPFIAAYQAGCTPNPCVICNRKIKFALLFDLAREKGYDFIASGHYGAIVRDAYSGRYLIRTAAYRSKDQSYVLYNLTQEQLSRLILPLSGMTKPQVRKLAEKLGFAVSDKPDSQDICFIDGSDYAGFIRRYSGQQEIPGDFVDASGKVLGRHRGVTHYTIGQRKGLGIALGAPAFVTAIDAKRHTITLSTREADVYTKQAYAHEINLLAWEKLDYPLRTSAKIRYAAAPAPCTVWPAGPDRVRVIFDAPVRALTPGQSIVFYRDDLVLGGGVIEKPV